jgi:hypothetical protein
MAAVFDHLRQELSDAVGAEVGVVGDGLGLSAAGVGVHPGEDSLAWGRELAAFVDSDGVPPQGVQVAFEDDFGLFGVAGPDVQDGVAVGDGCHALGSADLLHDVAVVGVALAGVVNDDEEGVGPFVGELGKASEGRVILA